MVDLPMSLLHEGHPRLKLEAVWQPVAQESPNLNDSLVDANNLLLAMLQNPNVA
ncbi:MAG: hypothetical protein R2865_12230 [Deinococcales bacterium]